MGELDVLHNFVLQAVELCALQTCDSAFRGYFGLLNEEHHEQIFVFLTTHLCERGMADGEQNSDNPSRGRGTLKY